MTADTAQTSGTPVSPAPAPMAASTPATPVAAKPIPLDTFCRDKSLSQGRRVELLAGFHHSEKRANRLFDTAENYETRFKTFAGAKPSKASPEKLAAAHAATAKFAAARRAKRK